VTVMPDPGRPKKQQSARGGRPSPDAAVSASNQIFQSKLVLLGKLKLKTEWFFFEKLLEQTVLIDVDFIDFEETRHLCSGKVRNDFKIVALTCTV
jgi:hypothetical protein